MIAERTDELAAFFAETFGPKAEPRSGHAHDTKTGAIGDDAIIALARESKIGPKFMRLWAGDTSDFGGDDSSADLALLSYLAFYTQDPAQLDRLFRRCGLCREKWERDDYRRRTIARALRRDEVYGSGSGATMGRSARPGSNGRASPADAGDGNRPRLHLPLGDFVAHLESHKYLHRPTGKLWPRTSVNAAVTPILSGIDEDGNPAWIPASDWLDEHEPVHQATWSPGDPEIIEGRLLHQGGWIEREDLRAFNLYRPPTIALGDPERAGPWLEHVRWLYPDHAGHITAWLAHRVQRPAEKVNHALLLGSAQGCGKDSLLKPVREAIGPWNYADASPGQVVGRFNGFLKSVILLIPELCDLGEFDRYKFYEHMKPIIAAPPTTLRCDEKFLADIAVLNACGVVFTSNQRIGIYLPAGDRRHFAAWSTADPATLPAGFFDTFHRWLDHEGGSAHVAAYLHAVDLSGFSPTAPPPKTEWFWGIVDSGRAPEESELSTLLDWMADSPGDGDFPNEGAWPDAVTLAQLVASEKRRTGWSPENGRASDFVNWLEDRKNRRQIPHRMEAVGYVQIRNDTAKDGLWSIGGVRMAIYARAELSPRDQFAAASQVVTGEWWNQ